MPNREEALRRILDAAAPSRMTEEQRRELVAHLENSIEAKVAAGAGEVDAVARAIEELGDLDRLARRFPPPGPARVTPEGAVLAEGTAYAATAVLVLAFFATLGSFVVPKLTEIFGQVRVPLPGFTVAVIDLSRALVEFPFAGAALMLALAASLWRFRSRIPRALGAWALALAVGLSLVGSLAVLLPLLSLMDSLGGIR